MPLPLKFCSLLCHASLQDVGSYAGWLLNIFIFLQSWAIWPLPPQLKHVMTEAWDDVVALAEALDHWHWCCWVPLVLVLPVPFPLLWLCAALPWVRWVNADSWPDFSSMLKEFPSKSSNFNVLPLSRSSWNKSTAVSHYIFLDVLSLAKAKLTKAWLV